MPALTWKEKEKQKTLYEIGYQYLVQNFHKFNPDQKIRVALDVIHIFNKDGSKTNDGKKIIYVVNGERERVTDSIEVLPSPITTENTQLPEQI